MCVCWMLKQWGQKLRWGFCSGQMFPLIPAERPLKEKAWECLECRWRPIGNPCERFLKIFFFLFSIVFHLDWIGFGGVTTCHYLNLRTEVKFKGINVAFSLPKSILTFTPPTLHSSSAKQGTVIQKTMAGAPQHWRFNVISVSIKSSIICLRLLKFNNSVQMQFHLC